MFAYSSRIPAIHRWGGCQLFSSGKGTLPQRKAFFRIRRVVRWQDTSSPLNSDVRISSQAIAAEKSVLKWRKQKLVLFGKNRICHCISFGKASRKNSLNSASVESPKLFDVAMYSTGNNLITFSRWLLTATFSLTRLFAWQIRLHLDPGAR